jgi:hypothetical protein
MEYLEENICNVLSINVEELNELLNQLDATIDDVVDFRDNKILELCDGREFYLFDSEASAYDEACEQSKNILCDCGVDYNHLKQFIDIDSAIDTDWFESALRESMEAYVEDIRDEWEDDDKTRLDVEMEDACCDTEEEFVDYLVGNAGDPIDWYEFNFGDIDEVATEHNLFDYDKIAEMCVDCDGIPHFLASYDGNEDIIENVYVYRIN